MSKIALVQFKASIDKKKNLPKILDYIKQAAKNNADMVTFPEYMMFYTPLTQTAKQVAQEAETINGEFVSAVAESAKNNSISIVGTMYEKSRKKDRVYDTSFIINKKGEVTGKYRKIHLYDALGFKESDKMSSGTEIPLPTKTSVGKMGMLICYDLRFPEMSRTLASSGTEILVAPSAWVDGPMKEEHWLTLNKLQKTTLIWLHFLNTRCFTLLQHKLQNRLHKKLKQLTENSYLLLQNLQKITQLV